VSSSAKCAICLVGPFDVSGLAVEKLLLFQDTILRRLFLLSAAAPITASVVCEGTFVIVVSSASIGHPGQTPDHSLRCSLSTTWDIFGDT